MIAGRESLDVRWVPIRLIKVLHRTFVPPYRALKSVAPKVRWLTHTGRHMPPYRAKNQELDSISEFEIGETITCSPLECSCTRVSSFELSMVQLPLPLADVR